MSNDWIDEEGFRANVGIILTDDAGKLLLGGRVSNKGWQFPQGGMLVGEEPTEAMYRELREEVGLEQQDVELLGVTEDWIRYRLPDKFVRRHSKPLCIGQKQRWFMLRLNCDADKLRFDLGAEAEFDRVRWVDYWRPVNEVIEDMHRNIGKQFAPELVTALCNGLLKEVTGENKSRRFRRLLGPEYLEVEGLETMLKDALNGINATKPLTLIATP